MRKIRQDPANIVYILVLCAGAPLVVWNFFSDSIWLELGVRAYVLTAGLFAIGLLSEVPRFASRWFWRSMIPIVLMHGLALWVVLGSTKLFYDLELELPTRMAWDYVAMVLFIEMYLAWWIIRATRPKDGAFVSTPEILTSPND